jgi:hypothetical protein
MKRNPSNAAKLHEDAKEIYRLNQTKNLVYTRLNSLLDKFEGAKDTAQRLAVINTLDSIITSEVYAWCNILGDITDDTAPCMLAKKEEAEEQLSILMELAYQIDGLRADVLDLE